MIFENQLPQGQRVVINGQAFIVFQSLGGQMALAVAEFDTLPAQVYIVEIPTE